MIEQINKNLHHSRNDEKLNARRSPMNRASHFLRFVQETNIDIYVNLDAPPEISPERTAVDQRDGGFVAERSSSRFSRRIFYRFFKRTSKKKNGDYVLTDQVYWAP